MFKLVIKNILNLIYSLYKVKENLKWENLLNLKYLYWFNFINYILFYIFKKIYKQKKKKKKYFNLLLNNLPMYFYINILYTLIN